MKRNLILATLLLAPLFSIFSLHSSRSTSHFSLFTSHVSLFSLHAQQVIDLAGVWSFAMNDQPVYDDYVMLPGSMLTNDKGNDVNVNTPWTGSLYDSSYYFNPYMEKYRKEGEMKFPFFLTPEKHYVGNAWYKRQFYVPQNWEGQRIRLFLERPHIETTVFINGQEVGHQMSLSTPHVYDVTKYVKVGSSNIVAIKVYNGIENVCVGQDSHSVTDQTQGNWNGIAGRIELQANPKKLNIKHVKVVPDVKKKMAYITVKLENHVDGVRFMPKTFYYVHAEAVAINSKTNTNPISTTHVEALSNTIHLTLNFGKRMQTWDEFSPVVYALTVYAGDDVYETQFGMRDISIDGRQFYMNGHPIWFRGTVENCCFPETGYPPTDEESWMKIFKKCREYGINHMRFHSYCPPEAAFAAADIMGMYLQPEGPSWPNHGVRLNRGMNIDKYLLEESKRIIDTYGNHPSFVMMAAGNEPAGDWVTYCNNWVKEMKKYDPSRVYCGASVGGGWAWDDGSEYHVKGGARGLDWDRQAPQSTDNYFDQILHPRNFKPASNASESVNTHPIIAHEQGQWCAFPDFKEIHQYDGVYKARNFEIFRDLLADNGMASQADNFLMASGKLQTLCYKYEIERNLRTKEYAGFQLLSLNDYSGQGTALVGPLNVFWKEKGYVNGNQWREFCYPLVILASFPKFVFTNDETPKIPISIYNAYSSAVSPEKIQYMIFSEDSLILADGTLESKTIPIGKDFLLGSIQCNFSQIEKPSKFTLLVNIDNTIVNHWDFWVYPKEMPNLKIKDKDIYITDTLDEKAMKTLRKGGNVLLTAAGKVKFGQDVKQTYLPVFWNTSWFKMRPPHTTGAYIDAQHPLFKEFPTDNWSNLNWWELLNKAQVMNLSELPASYQPPIQPIDTWHVSRKLGMLIEAKVLKGKLLMTTMDITNRLDQRVVARQMRHAILAYMNSDAFSPTLTLTPELITDFFEKEAPAVNMFTKDSPDELKPKLK